MAGGAKNTGPGGRDGTPPIRTLDLRFEGIAEAVAAFLVAGPEGPVLVETGPASTFGNLQAALAEHGLRVGDLRGALVTHIHLDHAGATGHLAERGVPIHVHRLGARHLIDPTRLLASAERIYGDQLEPLWGILRAVPTELVQALDDGDVVEVAGLRFEALATPGHARHHHAFRLGDVVFAGDVAGIRVPGAPLVAVPAVPPEFDPPAWRASIDLLAGLGASAVYLTHFGPLAAVAEHLAQLRAELADSVASIASLAEAGLERDAIVERFVERCRLRARSAGVTGPGLARFELANPVEASVDGTLRYLAQAGRLQARRSGVV